VSDRQQRRPHVVEGRLAVRELSLEERFVADRMNGERSIAELASATGVAAERVEQIVARLAAEGVVDPGGQAHLEPVPEVGSVRDLAALADLVERPADPELHAPAEPPTLQGLEDPPSAPALPTDDADDAEEDPAAAASELDHRKVYETRWHPLPLERRVDAAQRVTGSDLRALTFDPSPRVVAAILENATCGLDHVRMIALHHRTGTGLELVARRHDWLHDGLVERRLLRNPMLGEAVLGRIIAPKRLLATYKIAVDRDVPELSRMKCRGHLRQKWQSAPPDERADFLLRTEARCLLLMAGCTLDARTTAILCGRPINSAMFVQSIAKFGAAPPALLAHLVKQPFVRRNVPLKKMLLAHPNVPGDVKRSV
jgi:hypothetical protein